ncbi:hypothetical protein B9Z55_014367 [Caenorhabditis nigoni]|uniref:glutathione transferase n=1 Tax=Caenorhabditis nigoni TaxID=1611254 RepID=A0A2G5U5L7_9PELO|nr:hypothetical protein B9Z55_014367 [Caenorhabditis nigoni]
MLYLCLRDYCQPIKLYLHYRSAMIQYKLIYFDVRGLGEVSRQLFHLAGCEFEDVKIPRNDEQAWLELKKSTPFGQLPILKILDAESQNEIEIPQSSAIGRYLANQFGYAGKTPEEKAMVDAVIDQFKDFLVSQKRLTLAVRTKKSEEEINRVKEDIVTPAKDTYFKILKKLLENNSSGFLVGNDITWADLQISDNLTTLDGLGIFVPSEEPILAKFHEKIMNTPSLKTYFEQRPASLL